jgi:hypothetical protein
MGREKPETLYRILFFVFCAAGFVFLNAFILYFEDPGRYAPAPDFITALIVFAGLETVLAAGTFYCLLMVIRLQREEGEERDGEDDLLSLPPKIPWVRQKEEHPCPLPPFTPSSPQNFEKLLRILTMLVIVIGGIFILFIAAVVFITGFFMTP